MISTKKDAATIRKAIQLLRAVPRPSTIYRTQQYASRHEIEDAAQQEFQEWTLNYIVTDLLALLHDSQKPTSQH